VSAEFELLDREPLRDTPEGELWTSVLVDALEGMRQAVQWLDSSYGERRARIERAHEAGELKPARYRERVRDLERERKERQHQISSCEWFFFDPDSPLEFVCDVLNYPIEAIQRHARQIHGEANSEPTAAAERLSA
jgi:hypothetical protein